MRALTFTTKAFEQIMDWGREDIKIQQKIASLIFDILRNPFVGLGKPEPLKYGEYKGYWSRRITDEHRLIYKVTQDAIIIVSCRFHYPWFSMLPDPITEELHHIRQEYAAQFDFDMDAIVRHMQQEQSNGGREVTSLAKIDLRQAFAEVEAHKQGKIVLPMLSEFLDSLE